MGKGGYNGGSSVIHAGSGWVGRGSVTSQPGERKKKQPIRPPNPKKKGTQYPATSLPPAKGGGLTIPEIIARADRKVKSIEAELARTRKKLSSLERELAMAMEDAAKARNLPRKTALGIALHEAEQTQPNGKPKKRKARINMLSEAEREAERAARANFKSAPKEVVVEHRSAGILVGKRVVERS